jgi:Domain of unknown function (DUF4942)
MKESTWKSGEPVFRREGALDQRARGEESRPQGKEIRMSARQPITDLVPSVSIANMVNQRAAMMQRLQQACGLIQEAAEIAAAAHLGMPQMTVSREYSRNSYACNIAAARIKTDSSGRPWGVDASPQDDLDRALRLGIDCAAWQYLMHESGLRSLMDAKARETWDKSISDGEIPEFNEANVRSTFSMLHDSRGEMFERGVIACFKSLAWDYKTNLPQKFGKRIVMTYLTGWHSYEKHNQLDDLMRVMSILDGKPEPDHRASVGLMMRSAGLDGYGPKPGQCENDYLSIRTFKNTNGHITFKRLDLVDRMNLIIAKHYPGALPAPK